MSGKHVLLTGGTGFIGRHCIADLQARSFEVHATTSRTPPASDGVHWHRTDLLSGEQTAALMAKVRPDSLLHLGWYAEHGKFWQALENLDWVRASIALLRAFIAEGGSRMAFAGSCAEYDWTNGHCREDTTPLKPQGLYGVSKHAFRLIAEEAARRAGISCAWGRIFFLYGPGEQPGRLVPLVVRSQLHGEHLSISGGALHRDYLYVAEVASALVALLDSPLEGPVNIGSGHAISLRAMVERITAKCGHPELVDFRVREAAQKDAPLVVADTGRLGGELHWTPRVDLDRGLDLTIDWWRQHLNAGS
jgi:nucleoside-diphosphate-sugar epimerase